MKSLKAMASLLADPQQQLDILGKESGRIPPFEEKLAVAGLFPLKPVPTEIFQVNLGKMCNQVCKHCHVDAGPDRKEIMQWDTMQQCLDIIQATPSLKTIDLTGGAPEMNPDFWRFVTAIREMDRHIIVRCNLTIIRANKKYHDLPEFYREHGVEVVSSLPFYTRERTDRQRGAGVFTESVEALRLLNGVGYGKENSGLILNLVYNPAGAFLPPAQTALEREYKEVLQKDFGIVFNNLFTITNLPISRYLDYLLASGNYEQYMEKLVTAFNPAAAANVMCRNTLSVGWDGYLYDCDFNQMLDLKVDSPSSRHITGFDPVLLQQRNIIVNQHCYGCTAGAGSSCGGSIA